MHKLKILSILGSVCRRLSQFNTRNHLREFQSRDIQEFLSFNIRF